MPRHYLLDTNICIYITKRSPPEVRARFDLHHKIQLAMSVVTFGELRFGAEKSHTRERAFSALQSLSERIAIVELPESAGEYYGRIRADLQKRGQVIGTNDLWIAAHAMAEDWILVTNNAREFERVEGLRIENWVTAA